MRDLLNAAGYSELASGSVGWLYLDLNCFFASVEQQLRPELRGHPVIVVPVETDSTCAIAASKEAKRFGIKTGTRVGEARRLCPALKMVRADHERYVEMHHRVVQEVERHYPITTIGSIDEVAFRLDAARQPLAAALDLARRMKAGLRERVGECVTCSIGLAPNRFLAKVASDLEKPDGLVVLLAEELPGRLLELKPEDLPGIGRRMLPRLQAAGLRTLDQLWEAERAVLHRVWGGVCGDRFWHALHGGPTEEDAPVNRRSLGHSHVLAPALRVPPKAEIVARRLLLKAASRLRRLGCRTTHLHVSVRLEDGGRQEAQAHCAATSDSITLVQMQTRLWDRVMRQARWQRLKKVSVTLSGLEEATRPQQRDLFSGPEEAACARREHLSRVLDELNQRHGRDAVVIGFTPDTVRTFSGTKIAFSRIPEREEFRE
ncbi:MAG: hypothetical protein KDK99_11170 [Verrucomicrobiales bacterium]|nr:hypothetical protein [Verrucomicrobiales bacterium]